MALIVRGNKQYFIRSMRVGGRVTSRVVAKGERAPEVARAYAVFSRPGRDEIDKLEARLEARARRRAEAKARRNKAAERTQRADLDALLKGIAAEVKAIGAEAMRAAGFHLHRWTWRKRRANRGGDMATAITTITTGESEAKARAEIARAQSPEGARAKADEWEAFDRTRPEGHRGAIDIMRELTGSDPTRAVREKLIDQWTGDPIGKELLRRQMAAMRADLEGPSPSVVERLLVERIVICWLDLAVAERRAIRCDPQINIFNPGELSHMQKARDRASRRYVDGLKTLALIRQRALPALRLSLALKNGDGAAVATIEASGSPPGPGDPGEVRGIEADS